MSDLILMISLAVIAILNVVVFLCSLLKKPPCQRHKVIRLLNHCVAEIMVIFLIVRAIAFAQSFSSAPTWVVLIESVYFLVPLGIVNLIYFVNRKIRRR